MTIYNRTEPWEVLNQFSAECWDEVGELVKAVIDNNLADAFNAELESRFPNGCTIDQFHDCVSDNAEEIKNKLLATKKDVK